MTKRLNASPSPNQSSSKERTILISGAGIGGLALALALAQRGISSHIFERRECFTPEGAGIQIGPNGARILSALGLDAVISTFAGSPSHVTAYSGTSGLQITDLPIGINSNPNHPAPYWTMLRANLHGALVAAVEDNPLVRLSTARDVVAVHQATKHVTLTLSDNQSATGAACIAADGIHSRIRKLLFTSAPLVAIGKSASRAVVASSQLPDDIPRNKVGLWMAPNAHVVHYPVRAGRDTAIVAIFNDEDTSPDWTTPVSKDWVTSRASGLDKKVQEILSCDTHWQKWSLLRGPQVPTWVEGRIALLGDAAHPTLPFLAQGAVMALEDAAVLANLLTDTDYSLDNVQHALMQYQSQRAARCRRVVKASATNGRIYHQKGLPAWIRDRTMHALGGKRLINRLDWLYTWVPSSTTNLP